MNINDLSISPLSNQQSGINGKSLNSDEDFGLIIKDAVKSLENSQEISEQEIVKAVKGESPDLHQTIIELQSSDLQFQLGLQVRNKLIGAYEEIMRMQI